MNKNCHLILFLIIFTFSFHLHSMNPNHRPELAVYSEGSDKVQFYLGTRQGDRVQYTPLCKPQGAYLLPTVVEKSNAYTLKAALVALGVQYEKECALFFVNTFSSTYDPQTFILKIEAIYSTLAPNALESSTVSKEVKTINPQRVRATLVLPHNSLKSLQLKVFDLKGEMIDYKELQRYQEQREGGVKTGS